jgi:hypothetical protein
VSSSEDLRGAEVWINGDPDIEQPFWDVAAVSILQAPAAELSRKDIVVWRQSQSPHLHFKRGREGRTERDGLAATSPVGIASAIH